MAFVFTLTCSELEPILIINGRLYSVCVCGCASVYEINIDHFFLTLCVLIFQVNKRLSPAVIKGAALNNFSPNSST